MATIRIATNFNLEVEFESAPFHRRLFAWALDIFILVVYLLSVLKILSWITSFIPRNHVNSEYVDAVTILLAVPVFLYHPVCEVLMKGQSIGKKIVQLRVVNENGGRPSISQAVIRWIIRTSDLMVLVILINSAAGGLQNLAWIWQTGIAFGLLVTDIILVNITSKGQRLGDMLAHTMLISSQQKGSIEDTIFQHVSEEYKPRFPEVMQLSDRDINALKGILDAARKHHDYNLADRAAQKIKAHLRLDTSLSPFDFLDTLMKDYNYLSSR